LQQISLFSHLQFIGSFRHVGQIKAPQPTHVLLSLLQAQWKPNEYTYRCSNLNLLL